MMKKISSIAIILCAMSLLAKERITITVTDPAGNPVSNATVEVKTMNKLIVFGSDREADFDTHYVTTDAKGRAELRFNCITRCFSWGATAEGYYDGKWTREEFDGSETISPLGKIAIAFKEHEKELTTTLWPKKNPQPMCVHTMFPRVRVPEAAGQYGFDLQVCDWMPPVGNGLVADFIFIKSMGEDGCNEGMVKFPGGCYLARKTPCEDFPTSYCVDTNREFSTDIQLAKSKNGDNEILVGFNADSYLVFRTRCVNYGVISGPFRFEDKLIFGKIAYNPRQGDMNLEPDKSKNLAKQRREIR